jgi:secreted trypsin-like serine protease
VTVRNRHSRSFNSMFATCLLLGFAAVAHAAEKREAPLSNLGAASNGSEPYRAAVAAFQAGVKPKIVSGQPAPDAAYPSQVSLEVSSIPDPVAAHFCGGSVYDHSWIITAAHCVIDTPRENIVIVAGTNKLAAGVVRHTIKQIIVKGDYNSTSHDNDIALLELNDALVFNTRIRSVPLLDRQTERTRLVPNQMLTVIGWGATQEGGDVIRDLEFVDVPFVDHDICNAPLSYDGQITENMICAGPLSGGKDSCQGDSGGPLLLGAPTAPKLAGIVSWGEGCARPRKVGVYTRMANFTDWVSKCVSHRPGCP